MICYSADISRSYLRMYGISTCIGADLNGSGSGGSVAEINFFGVYIRRYGSATGFPLRIRTRSADSGMAQIRAKVILGSGKILMSGHGSGVRPVNRQY
jgi:hypothetical protein